MKKIYLATPYSFKNPDGTEDFEIMEKRFQKVTIVAGLLMKKGLYVFSPITHCHPIACHHILPRTYEFWLNYDKVYLDWCDEVYVYMQDGWKESKGVAWEIEYASSLDKRITYIEENYSGS